MNERILALAQQEGLITAADVIAAGLPREYLPRLAKRGILERVGRGLYRLSASVPDRHHTLAELAKRIPNGVVALLSALNFHELTTQNPFEVWLAIGGKDWRPSVSYPPVRYVYMTGGAMTEGVEAHLVDGVPVKVFSVAKTVVDCFKYRNKIGIDVALEALREGWKAKRFTMDELMRYAEICRVKNVMRPYVESLV